jgi:hypothetical protein
MGEARRRRLARLAAPHRRSVARTAVVAAGATCLLVLPTVMLVVPWLDQAVATWPR